MRICLLSCLIFFDTAFSTSVRFAIRPENSGVVIYPVSETSESDHSEKIIDALAKAFQQVFSGQTFKPDLWQQKLQDLLQQNPARSLRLTNSEPGAAIRFMEDEVEFQRKTLQMFGAEYVVLMEQNSSIAWKSLRITGPHTLSVFMRPSAEESQDFTWTWVGGQEIFAWNEETSFEAKVDFASETMSLSGFIGPVIMGRVNQQNPAVMTVIHPETNATSLIGQGYLFHAPDKRLLSKVIYFDSQTHVYLADFNFLAEAPESFDRQYLRWQWMGEGVVRIFFSDNDVEDLFVIDGGRQLLYRYHVFALIEDDKIVDRIYANDPEIQHVDSHLIDRRSAMVKTQEDLNDSCFRYRQERAEQTICFHGGQLEIKSSEQTIVFNWSLEQGDIVVDTGQERWVFKLSDDQQVLLVRGYQFRRFDEKRDQQIRRLRMRHLTKETYFVSVNNKQQAYINLEANGHAFIELVTGENIGPQNGAKKISGEWRGDESNILLLFAHEGTYLSLNFSPAESVYSSAVHFLTEDFVKEVLLERRYVFQDGTKTISYIFHADQKVSRQVLLHPLGPVDREINDTFTWQVEDQRLYLTTEGVKDGIFLDVLSLGNKLRKGELIFSELAGPEP